ncbi:MAG: hypothetical protein GWO20_13085 [Candidatus Korarchaeota archaeon]|nr:hypothetical protein [Candidatus Korarchaeota archaeon]NIU84352.1 hypothetical protein [Candidatus Thorarchaeota archaeon]NIW14469.1 hypothetical protein [Candidatus Thorarchaeota archaeon]NIW52546.1 hypothetical protein [Candidatus Korarchaeota archaeon]
MALVDVLARFTVFQALEVLLTLVLGAFFLWLGLKLIGVPKDQREGGRVFVTQIINTVIVFLFTLVAFVSYIALIGIVLSWVVIKYRHDTTWVQAVVAWFLAILIPTLIAIAIFYAIGGSLELWRNLKDFFK